MKNNKYRIKKYVYGNNLNDYLHECYVIEKKCFGIFWCQINDFKPIKQGHTFRSVEEAKDTLTKYIEYKINLSESGKIIEILKI